LLRQHADVDVALLSGDVDQCELPLVTIQHPDHLARYAQTHRSALPFHRRRPRSSPQTRGDFLDGVDGPWHRGRDGLAEADALVDTLRLTADDDRVRRFAAECLPGVGERP